jgi:hypothetical protein
VAAAADTVAVGTAAAVTVEVVRPTAVVLVATVAALVLAGTVANPVGQDITRVDTTADMAVLPGIKVRDGVDVFPR